MTDLTTIYEGANLAGAQAGVSFIPIVRPGVLNAVEVRHKRGTVQSGAAVFNVFLNGAEIPGAGVTIANGAESGDAGGLTVNLIDGDEIVLNLVSGNVAAPITLNLTVDDGETGGAALPPGDLSAETNRVEKVQGYAIVLPSVDDIIQDDFNDGTIDAIWNKSSAPNAPVESGGVITLPNGNATLGLATNPSMVGRFVSFRILPGTNAPVLRIMDPANGKNIQIVDAGGYVRTQKNYSENVDTNYPAPRNATTFLKIAFTNSTFIVSFSTNGTDWTVLQTEPLPPDMSLAACSVLFYGNGALDDFKSNLPLPGAGMQDRDLTWFEAAKNGIRRVKFDELAAAIQSVLEPENTVNRARSTNGGVITSASDAANAPALNNGVRSYNSGYWNAPNGSSLLVTLPALREITRIDLYSTPNDESSRPIDENALYVVESGIVEAKIGNSWQRIASFSENTGVYVGVVIPKVKTNQIRLLNLSSRDGTVRLSEIEIY